MPIRVSCACGKAYQFKDEFAGRRAKCPACGGIVVICSTGGSEARPAKSAQAEAPNQAKQNEISKPSSVEGGASPGLGTPAAPRTSRSGKRRVLAVGVLAAVICVIVVATIVLLSWTQKATPRQVMIGHWQNVGTKDVADNPNYKSTTDAPVGGHLFVSGAEAWRVEPGERPVKVRYEVVEENLQDFWLDMRATPEQGKTAFSRVSFSPDRQVMYVTTRVDIGEGFPLDMASRIRSQIGGATSTTTYKRIDDRTVPPILEFAREVTRDDNLPGSPIVGVNLTATETTDADLEELKELKSLRSLSLYETKVTDAGLRNLKALENLQELYLGGPMITDAGLKQLGELKGLRALASSGPRSRMQACRNSADFRAFRGLKCKAPR